MNANALMQQSLLLNEKVYDLGMSTNYRRYDEEFVHTPAYAHIAGKITSVISEFSSPISVLDVGCGTGRYFHTLKNASEILGIDVSGNMLLEAKNPFRKSEIAHTRISLIEGNFYNYDFGDRKFDFIYSVGVLGEHTVFDQHVCHKLFSLLKEGGKLFFSVVDIEPRKDWKRKMAERIYPMLPSNLKKVLDKRWETCYMTYTQLDEIMKREAFSDYTIERYVSEDPLWVGVHLECVARR
jgi:SAM-dependent methyltransferase